MARPTGLIVGLLVALLLGVVLAPSAAATNYTVSTNPFTATHTLSSTDLWDTYELTAQNGQDIAYSVTVLTAGACAKLFFIKGHNANEQSLYYVDYSQTSCVTTYSKSFPVESSDGTQFTVLIETTYSGNVSYVVTVGITTPVVPSWAIGAIVLIVILVVVMVIVALVRRRRKPAMMPPTAPSPYGGPTTPAYPGAPPPAYPQQQPPQQPPPYPPPP